MTITNSIVEYQLYLIFYFILFSLSCLILTCLNEIFFFHFHFKMLRSVHRIYQILKNICKMNEEKIELKKLNDLPNVPQVVNDRARIQIQVGLDTQHSKVYTFVVDGCSLLLFCGISPLSPMLHSMMLYFHWCSIKE